MTVKTSAKIGVNTTIHYYQGKMKTKKNQNLKDWIISFEDLFESIPTAITILDANGKVMMINRAQEQQSRVERGKVLGTNLHDTWQRVLEQADVLRHYWKLLKQGIPFSIVSYHVTPQFYDLNVSGKISGFPLLSGKGFIIISDLSDEIKQNKQALQQLNLQLSETSSFLNDLFDSSPNAVLTTDENGFITYSNNTVEPLFGFSKGELLWQHVSILMENPLKWSELIQSVNKKGRTEIKGKTKNGRMFPVGMRINTINSKRDEPLSQLFTLEDLTYEKTMEFSISELLKFERLLSELSVMFVNMPADKIEFGITDALRRIGQALNADRCHLLQYERETCSFQIIHSWCSDGIEPVPIGIGAETFPWTSRELAEKRVVQMDSMSEAPEEARLDKQNVFKYGTKSHLSIPLVDNQTIVGAISLDLVREERRWIYDLIKRLRIVGEMLFKTLVKKQADEKMQQAFIEINRLKDQLVNERNYLREEIKLEHNFENIIGQSEAIRNVFYKVTQVAPMDTTVLIQGETGTGKELLARAIHNRSQRNDRQLIKVNCASLPSNLIESELFGHEKGAFTGAHIKRIGRFELANNATLFLDEIGELSLEIQSKLLRVLQEREFERLGSSHTIKVDVRVITATNRNLKEEVEAGRFRSDLLYRLNVFPITAPTLCQRKDDIPLLVNWLLRKTCTQTGKQIQRISTDTMTQLEQYNWPGNVRELKNVIERAVLNSNGNVLKLADKLESNQIERSTQHVQTEQSTKQERKTIRQVEREYLLKILQETNWQIEGKNGAAVILDLPPSTLRHRIKKNGLQKP